MSVKSLTTCQVEYRTVCSSQQTHTGQPCTRISIQLRAEDLLETATHYDYHPLGPRQTGDSKLDSSKSEDTTHSISQTKSVTDQVAVQQAQIASLQQELNNKVDDIRKLHGIIQRSGQNSSSVSDDNINRAFSDLRDGILRIVKLFELKLNQVKSRIGLEHALGKHKGLTLSEF
ncbi:uncharacterized protein Z518_02648 [Rhinocladiella mackenziei CBS 650.93]|uniref:Uncharacterized protein n=1 Tax=Rhinocladiella mackenziei CBS 650.93 TaxID=1442369 RepID=A0A0D2IQ41_9EURO|nr:uncharacterized protein Z518_02648 [Rhinocladiella mackenziei CBS 650.93]KIX07994.1 hypothetical protein Z518_02648 [Rhinocladiella mackenziei CBS 650.93]